MFKNLSIFALAGAASAQQMFTSNQVMQQWAEGKGSNSSYGSPAQRESPYTSNQMMQQWEQLAEGKASHSTESYGSPAYRESPYNSQQQQRAQEVVHEEAYGSFPSQKVGSAANGYASTTRYWDCSGGSCGCGFGNSNKPQYCNSNALFSAPAGNKYGAKFYGSAAVSQALGGGNWQAPACGKCWKVTGSANVGNMNHSTTIVLKATNYCPPDNPVCNGKAHFDIAAPGFDYPNASISNTCDQVSSEQALKTPQTCAYWMIHSQDPGQNCDCNRFSDKTLRDGCNNFKSLGWNNSGVNYEQVDCPSELAMSPPCWNQNGGKWPSSPPATCAAPATNSFMEYANYKFLE